MTKEMLEACEEFLKDEKNSPSNYNFKSDIFKELRHDKEQEKEAESVSQKFSDFQDRLRKIFMLDENHFDINYYIISDALAEKCQYQGLNPRDAVYAAMNALRTVLVINKYSKLEANYETNKLKPIL